MESTPVTEPRSESPSSSLPNPPSNTSNKEDQPETKLKRTPRGSIWLDTWLFEWISLAFSMACFAAIAIVLRVYDGKLRPEIPYGLSLNAIVSTLATGCKSALVLVIGEAISQLKWLWFQDHWRKRQVPLLGMQTFDAASRGPLGSVVILFQHRGRSLASFGALVTILLLAFDPFVQQILDYPARSTIDTSPTAIALAPQLRQLDFHTLFYKHRDDLDSPFIRGYFSTPHQNFSVPPQCPSGNCTWDRFSSLGYCSQCSNLSTTAKVDCRLSPMTRSFDEICKVSLPLPGSSDLAFNVTLNTTKSPGKKHTEVRLPLQLIWNPYGPMIDKVFLKMHDNPGEVFRFPSYTLAGVTNALVALVYIEIGIHDIYYTPESPVSNSFYIRNATGCSISTCLRDYDVRVDNGVTSIQSQNIDFGTAAFLGPTQSSGIDRPDGAIKNAGISFCWMPGLPNPEGSQGTKEFAFCDDRLPDLRSEPFAYLPFAESPEVRKWSLERNGSGLWVGHTLGMDRTILADRLANIAFENTMENMAASWTGWSLERTNQTFNGTSYVLKIFVKVRWPWMIYPTLLVLGGAIFFGISVAASKKSYLPLWKSSALASYYHRLERIGEDEDVYQTISIMEKKAETLDVRLRRSESNGRLILRELPKPEAH